MLGIGRIRMGAGRERGVLNGCFELGARSAGEDDDVVKPKTSGARRKWPCSSEIMAQHFKQLGIGR